MSGQKIKVAFFTIPEYEEEQEWLRKMHNEGWSLADAWLPGIYRFKECLPEDVIYQLDYNPEGRAERSEYIQMFHDCGWEYITDMAGYSYFRKPVSEMVENEEEIFCDDASKMDMMERVYKGRMIPLLVILFAVILPQLFLQASMDYWINHVVFVIYILLLIVYIAVIVRFKTQYTTLKKRLNRLV